MTTLDDLDLGDEDQRMRAGPIEHAEVRIAALDEESYRVSQLAERSDDSLSEQRGDYKPEDAKALFAVARVVFGDQIKRDCDQLTEFNRADSQERRDALGDC